MATSSQQEHPINPPKRDYRVAVVGGGMCGVTLAIVLSQAGVEVDLFESHSEFGEAGASVTLGANAIRAFALMGLLDRISASTRQKPQANRMLFTVNTEHGEEELDVDDEHPAPHDLSCHRVAFIDALTPLLPSHRVHFNKRCTDISYAHSSSSSGSGSRSKRYKIHFGDGTCYETDLVIGADGIRSAVRKVVVHGLAEFPDTDDSDALVHLSSGARFPTDEDENLMFTGTQLYRALIPYETLKKAGVKSDLGRMKNCIGKNGNIFTVPIKGGSLINVGAFTSNKAPSTRQPPLPQPWVLKDVPNSEVLSHFDGWCDDMRTILRCMGSASYWSLHSMGPVLERYVREGVALVGDAAHASTSYLGAGVGQGIEDVYLLWKLLSDPRASRSNLEAILDVYDTIRRPRANYVIAASAEVPNLIYPKIADPCNSRTEKIEAVREFRKRHEGIKGHDVEVDAMKAVDILVEGGYFQQKPPPAESSRAPHQVGKDEKSEGKKKVHKGSKCVLM